MSSITLDSIRDAADRKYGHVDIDLGDGNVTRLRNALRLNKKERDALQAVQDELTGEAEDADVDQVAVFEKALRIVAENKAQADRLISAIGGDLAVLAEVFSQYSEGTQAGEA